MSNEIQLNYNTGATLYAIVLNAIGQLWNTAGTPAFETLAAAHWASYAVALTEEDASGVFAGTFPVAIATPGAYDVTAYEQAGGSPAVGDRAIAANCIEWSGSAVLSLAAVLSHGDAHWTPPSDGTVAVNHNTGGTDAMRYMSSGVGVEGATIRAYLQADYTAGDFTIRGRSTTRSDGRWVAPMYLSSGSTYVITFEKPGEYGLDTVTIAV